MKKFMKSIDLFCYRHPKFGVPNLMLVIVIGTVVVWLASAMDTTGTLYSLLAMSPERLMHGEVWRLVTFVFIPQSSGLWLLLWLYMYYFIGSSLEREWGTGRFTIYYLFGMLLTIIYSLIAYFIGGVSTYATASYINLSMFFAFATLFPDMQLLVFFIIPVKIKWLAVIDALYFLYEVIQMLGQGYGLMSFLPIVAILNYFLFCGDTLVREVMPSGHRQRKNTVDFKREVSKMKFEQKNRDYTRKCEVCGRTDADHPELEFRYCSRCTGYHCYCQDHINNHVHHTE